MATPWLARATRPQLPRPTVAACHPAATPPDCGEGRAPRRARRPPRRAATSQLDIRLHRPPVSSVPPSTILTYLVNFKLLTNTNYRPTVLNVLSLLCPHCVTYWNFFFVPAWHGAKCNLTSFKLHKYCSSFVLFHMILCVIWNVGRCSAFLYVSFVDLIMGFVMYPLSYWS